MRWCSRGFLGKFNRACRVGVSWMANRVIAKRGSIEETWFETPLLFPPFQLLIPDGDDVPYLHAHLF